MALLADPDRYPQYPYQKRAKPEKRDEGHAVFFAGAGGPHV